MKEWSLLHASHTQITTDCTFAFGSWYYSHISEWLAQSLIHWWVAQIVTHKSRKRLVKNEWTWHAARTSTALTQQRYCKASFYSPPCDFFRQLNQLTVPSCHTCVLPPLAQRLGACLSSCFICLWNCLFGEALNVASLGLYADHINANKASNYFPNVHCRKITFQPYLCYCLYLKI